MTYVSTYTPNSYNVVSHTHSFDLILQSVKSYSGFRAMNTVRVPSVVAHRGVSSGRGTLQIMAARVGGVEIPNAKPIEYSLQYIYGIGHTTAKAICVDTVRSD